MAYPPGLTETTEGTMVGAWFLGLLSAGQSRETILQEYPYLEGADIDAVLAFAARQADHPIIAAE